MTSFDPATEAAALLKRDAEWATAAAAGQDVEQILSYWTDDATVIPSGQPIAQGKAAIRSFVLGSLSVPGFKIHWLSNSVTFSPDGQMAYLQASTETRLTGPDGNPITIHSRAVTIWRRDADGQWRCVIDIWNEPPAPTAA